MYEKLKSFLTDDAFFLAVLVALVGVTSFGLGRQSIITQNKPIVSGENRAGVVFTSAERVAPQPEAAVRPVVASRSGTKYHLLDCPGATNIKEENRLTFDSALLAEAAGYSPAANCPGLQ